VATQHARWQPGPTRHSTPATTGWPPTRTCWASAFSHTAQSTALSSARADNPGRTWVSRDRGSTPGRDPDHNHSAADSVEDGALFRTGPRVESTTGQTVRSRERRQPPNHGGRKAGVARGRDTPGKKVEPGNQHTDSSEAPQDGSGRRPASRGDPPAQRLGGRATVQKTGAG